MVFERLENSAETSLGCSQLFLHPVYVSVCLSGWVYALCIYVCLSGWICALCMYVCMCLAECILWVCSWLKIWSLRAGVTGNCDLPGTELGSSERAVRTELLSRLSSPALHAFQLAFLTILVQLFCKCAGLIWTENFKMSFSLQAVCEAFRAGQVS